jgi:hypothetical protein
MLFQDEDCFSRRYLAQLFTTTFWSFLREFSSLTLRVPDRLTGTMFLGESDQGSGVDVWESLSCAKPVASVPIRDPSLHEHRWAKCGTVCGTVWGPQGSISC